MTKKEKLPLRLKLILIFIIAPIMIILWIWGRIEEFFRKEKINAC